MAKFDPNLSASSDFGIFGIESNESDSKIVLLPVPWEATTSYGRGAKNGPKIILKASEQIDLYDLETDKPYEVGIHMREISEEIENLNDITKEKAQEVIRLLTNRDPDIKTQLRLTEEVNEACKKMTDWVYRHSAEVLKENKLLGLIGGDHSTPLGAIKAISEKYKGDLGILHIDAHADLRDSYQGFQQSHASIMRNVMNLPLAPKKLVQVAIRDYCEEENDFLETNKDRIHTFFDLQLKQRQYAGESWQSICDSIVEQLPQQVYISFDIDGLDPSLCPNTGTPVAGGLSLNEAFYLFNRLHTSGRRLIGFDLNEVSTGEQGESEWDGNVGARVLYKLCGWLAKSTSR